MALLKPFIGQEMVFYAKHDCKRELMSSGDPAHIFPRQVLGGPAARTSVNACYKFQWMSVFCWWVRDCCSPQLQSVWGQF